MRVETKTEIQTKEIDITTYIADDGKEFDDARKCEQYELDIKQQDLKRKLEQIQTCKEMNDCPPVDGGEYCESHDFRWYLPKTQEEADVINQYYKLRHVTISDEIGDWVCIELYDIDDPTEGTYIMSIKHSLRQVQKLFNALGYDVSISKREEEENPL